MDKLQFLVLITINANTIALLLYLNYWENGIGTGYGIRERDVKEDTNFSSRDSQCSWRCATCV